MQGTKTVVGVDIAKRVFQLHWVEMETGELLGLRLTRTKFVEHFGNRAPCLVGMEACGGAQHWARRLLALGHDVRLLPAKMVRPFVSGNKNDAHDAQAIWTGVQQPGVKTVAVKSEEQQGILALHRMRQQLVKFRTAQINGLRGLLTEYGEVMPRGRAGMNRDMTAVLERVSERLPAMTIETLREQWARVAALDTEIDAIERRIGVWHRQNVASRRIAAIPGVGVLTATAAVATMGDPATFRSGREFAAWLGLVPRHTGTGGRVRMLGISKRGDTYLRTLLIHGARSALARGKAPSEWQLRLARRRPSNVVAVALANKTAARSGLCWPTTGCTNRTLPASPPERGWGGFGRRVASASGESRRFAPSPLRYGPSGDSPLAPALRWLWPEGTRPACDDTGRLAEGGCAGYNQV